MPGLLFSALLLAISLSPPASVEAHVGTTVYPIYEIPSSDLPDLWDGTLADWEDALPHSSLTHNDFLADGDYAADPGNLAWRIFLAWNYASQQIYFAVERLDDVYVEGPGDQTAIAIDGDHSGGQYVQFGDLEWGSQERRLLENSQAQFYTIYPDPAEQKAIILTYSGPWVTEPPYTEAGSVNYGEEPNYYLVEGYVTPWDALDYRSPDMGTRSALYPAKIIGFQIWVDDGDDVGQGRNSFLLGAPSNLTDPRIWADSFADGELIACYQGDCSGNAPSSVRQDAWARIKVTLRPR